MNTNMKELTLEEMELVTGGKRGPNLKPVKDGLVHWFLTEAVPEAERLKEAGGRELQKRGKRGRQFMHRLRQLGERLREEDRK